MRKGFTLIELLVVLAIIAILAVVLVLTLNPAELLRQSRDANRLSDLSTLNAVINLYNTDQAGAPSYSLGAASTSYLSVYDPSSTITGDQCQGLGMPATPAGYGYSCSASSSYRTISGNGWIPINFSNISSGAPFGSLPVDPANQTSSDLYYTYQTNGRLYQLSAFLESAKYAKTGENDGSNDPTLAESGSGLTTFPSLGRGLVGYWPLNEGSGTALDWSGNQNNGTWSGTPVGAAGYYSPGHVWNWGGAFDGNTDYITSAMSSGYGFGNTTFTVTAWINTTSSAPQFIAATGLNGNGWGFATNFGCSGSQLSVALKTFLNSAAMTACSNSSVATGNWTFVGAVITTNTTIISGNSATLYINGAAVPSVVTAAGLYYATSSWQFTIGARDSVGSMDYFSGLIDDFRIYDRGLSATEMQEIYNAEH